MFFNKYSVKYNNKEIVFHLDIYFLFVFVLYGKYYYVLY